MTTSTELGVRRSVPLSLLLTTGLNFLISKWVIKMPVPPASWVVAVTECPDVSEKRLCWEFGVYNGGGRVSGTSPRDPRRVDVDVKMGKFALRCLVFAISVLPRLLLYCVARSVLGFCRRLSLPASLSAELSLVLSVWSVYSVSVSVLLSNVE